MSTKDTPRPFHKTLPAVSLTRANAQRQAKQAQAEADARKPEAIKVFDRQLYRLLFLTIASKVMDGSPGSLRVEFERLAVPAGLTLRNQKGVQFWTKPPRTLHGPNNFQTYFGIAGEPIRCKDTCGLTGHLFDNETSHDPATIREYIAMWSADIEDSRERERSRYAIRQDHRGGASSITYPSW